jgi:hypothetical protein
MKMDEREREKKERKKERKKGYQDVVSLVCLGIILDLM